MHIVHFASEMAPVAKVGGLADVLLGLPRELSFRGCDVDILLPKYDCMDSSQVRDLAIVVKEMPVSFEGSSFATTVWEGWVENIKVYFIEPHHPRHFFHRGCFYGCDDDIDRYLFFCRAGLEYLARAVIAPDILHLHDWQSAAVAPLYYEHFRPRGYAKPRLIFTIHNIDYQGICPQKAIAKVGLDFEEMASREKLGDDYREGYLNLLKGGIIYSDLVTTVSPNYAKEVLTPEGGRGLEMVLRRYLSKFKGILNGIDYHYWNPETDRFLPARYSSREMPRDHEDSATLDKKAYIKRVVREQLHLAQDHRPIVGCITRLVPQKGISLIKYTLKRTLEKGGQFLLLGHSPIPEINAEFHLIGETYLDHPHAHLQLTLDEEFGHRLFAASDMLIVPSLFEPCGLTQMIALRYGTIPIVRKTGGLADTIIDVDYSGKPFEETNGYSFDFPDATGVDSALNRAFACWYEDPDRWRRLMVNGMRRDFSWERPAEEYHTLYRSLLQ